MDLHGSTQENYDFGLNQIVILPFPRHPRSIAFDPAFIRRYPRLSAANSLNSAYITGKFSGTSNAPHPVPHY